MKHLMWVAAVVSFLWACDSTAIFKETEDIKDSKWFVKQVPKFTFEIKDETIAYNIYYVVRNTISYPYYNLYLNRHLLDPTGKAISIRLEEIMLFDAKSGKPMGNGVGDIFDHKVVSSTFTKYKFPKKGKYTLQIEQYMRQNPLNGIISVGIVVEPAVVK